MLSPDPATTALVLVDIQNGTLAMAMAPHAPETVIANAALLASRFAEAGMTVVQVRVDFAPDLGDLPQSAVDVPLAIPPGGPPPGFAEPPPELATITPDVRITKHQWSAFYGTELDLQLRRRGVATVVLAGLMTNFGVELTARDAWQHHYAVIVAEDATSAPSADMHSFAVTRTLPRVGRVRKTAQILGGFDAEKAGTPRDLIVCRLGNRSGPTESQGAMQCM